jgi:Zn-dependent alcohol dehydrogenase
MKLGKFGKSALRLSLPGVAYAVASSLVLDHARMPEEVKGLLQAAGGAGLGLAIASRDLASGLGVAIGGGVSGGVKVVQGLRMRAYLAQLATPSQRQQIAGSSTNASR